MLNARTPQVEQPPTNIQEAPQLAPPCKGTDPGAFASRAWSPEVFDFYGDPETILAKIDAVDMDLCRRRVFALTVESAGRADVRLFEQDSSDGQWAVLAWQGETFGNLRTEMDEAIFSNRGVHCVGEQVKGTLGNAVTLQLAGKVPAPATPRAAFAHTLRAHGEEEFVRATAALLC